jgi:glycine/D-amino acid oxidase-like deaminating enzyme
VSAATVEVDSLKPPTLCLQVETAAGTVRCDKAVITAGAWVGKLLRTVAGLELPTQPIHTTVGYYQVENRSQWDANCFPVFIM